MKWEEIEDLMFRAKVPNGWLVKYVDDVHVSLHEDQRPQYGYEWRHSLCFVPDTNHEWEIE